MPIMFFLFLLFCQSISAATVSYDWTASWINANPDGRLVRPVIAINQQWPPPTIEVNKGDTISVKLTNSLGNQTVGLHWHGLHQNGTNAQDGPSGVTQCSIPPGQSYTYTFNATEPGSYWYHSHENGQYPDGLRGPLVIRDPSPPFKYDHSAILTLSDWYHDLMPTLLPQYLIKSADTSGAEPIPYSALINDARDSCVTMQPGKTYYFHIVNMAGFAQMHLEFDQHNLTIVEIDGVYIQPRNTSQLYVANGQRYGVLVTAKSSNSTNYAVLASMDTSAFDHTTSYLQTNVTATLDYSAGNAPSIPVVKQWTVFDDLAFIPLDQQPLLPNADMTIIIDLGFFDGTDVNGTVQNRAGFNGTTYLQPIVPTLYTVLSSGGQATNPVIYGHHSNPFVLTHNQVIDIQINNYDTGPHPMHIHGHQPQIVAKAANTLVSNSTKVYTASTDVVVTSGGNPAYPPRRDTWTLAPSGVTTIRFRADNPGVWFLHCHMEWHMSGGLLATIIEAPLQLQQSQPTIPSAMASICAAQGVPTAGNAAGNSKNYTDLTGAPSRPREQPWGANIR